MSDDPSLDAAYALKDQRAVRRLYQTWAASYDTDFVEAEGYQLPQRVAEAYAAAGGRGPVLDVGAGTGTGGVALAAQGIEGVDGLDLSPEMLAIAHAKGVYRNLIEADILKPLQMGPYAGVVSAGTFTFGHVGPKGLINLLDVAAPGALFVISVNAGHFADAGFEAALHAEAGRIVDLGAETIRIYDDRATPEHRQDTARLLRFRKV